MIEYCKLLENTAEGLSQSDNSDALTNTMIGRDQKEFPKSQLVATEGRRSMIEARCDVDSRLTFKTG